MAGTKNYLEFDHRVQWRRWLEGNHTTETEARLRIFKKKYRGEGLTLEEAVEEALCFGWIDGVLQPLDERQYALRFSPRTATSTWSMSNIRRVEKMVAEGKMTPAGSSRVDEAKANGEWDAAIQREQVEVIPEALERALQQHAGALAAYQTLPDSKKKQYIYWVQRAKREETKQSRILKIVAEVLER
jgi:uncharacterized protein YdeI (YjbR/CyaY-like superfamily)